MVARPVAPPVIGRAALADAPAILALQKLAYRSEALLYDDWTLPPLVQTLDSLEAELAQSVALAARADGALVGSVRARVTGDVCHIGRLVVHPDWQGRGLGTALMQHVERECAQTRRFQLFTGSRSTGNIRLYERLGYRRTHEKTLSPAVTLVYLEKIR
jgi:ribosomal protein S18 acetylase RimI-like enzyme